MEQDLVNRPSIVRIMRNTLLFRQTLPLIYQNQAIKRGSHLLLNKGDDAY